MTPLVRKLLPVEKGERVKVAQFMLVGFLLQAGLAMAMSGADSSFLADVGADKLPRIYLLVPAMMLAYVPICSALLSRWGVYRVFTVSLGLVIAGGTGLWLAFIHLPGDRLWVCYAAKLYVSLWYVGLYTLYWCFIDAYFDLFDAKRLYALLSAGAAAGAIVGGSLVGPICRHFGVASLFLGWSAFAAAAWPVASRTRRRWKRLEAVGEEEAEELPLFSELLKIVRRLAGSRYTLVVTLVLFCTLVATTTCEFQYYTIFSAGRGEQDLAALLGRLMALVNVFNFVVTLFVFERLVKRFGVRNVALIQCIAYVIVFSWLLLDGGFPAAVAGFFAFQGLMTAVDFNNANLLFAGLPADGGRQMRTVIEGICEPLATAAAGFMLLLFVPVLSPEQISLAGVAIALVGLAFAFVLRHDYASAIAANLRRHWLDLSASTRRLWRNVGIQDLELAETRTRTARHFDAIFALRVLWAGDPDRAVAAMVEFLRRCTVDEQVHAGPLLVEMLGQPGSPAREQIERWLDDRETVLNPELAAELGRLGMLPDRRTEELLRSQDPGERSAAAATLWRSWRVADSRRALLQVEELLARGDERSVSAGLGALGRLGEARYAYLLRDYLADPSPAIRRAALESLRAVAAPSVRVLVPEVLELLRHETGPERLIALDAFERMADSASLPPALVAAAFFTPAERRRLETLILKLGPRTVPILITAVQDHRLPSFGRLVALRALAGLALPQLRLLAKPLVESLAQRVYLFLGAYVGLQAGARDEAGRAVLMRICRDYPDEAMEVILQVLTLAGHLPDYETLMSALRGERSKERGYAIETIEQACHRDTFALLLPLLDGRPIPDQVAFARERDIAPALAGGEVLLRALDAGPPLAVAASAQALLTDGDPEHSERVMARAVAAPDSLLAATILSWMARADGRVSEAERPTPVECVRGLMEAPEFEAFRSEHFAFMAPHVRPIRLAAGQALCHRGEPLSGVWLVRSGEVREEGSGRIVDAGGVAGGEALRGARAFESTVFAHSEASAFFVSAEVLRRCAEVHPALCISLFARKLAA